MKFYSLPVSYLKEYLYCRRIPYFYEFYGIKSQYSPWLSQGTDLHITEEKLLKRRTFVQFNISKDSIFKKNVSLKSETLQLHGFVDGVLIDTNKIYPIEIKTGKATNVRKGHILQLVAYALLLEEQFQKECNVGFILYRDKGLKNVPITIDADIKQETKETLQNLHKMLQKGGLPTSDAHASKCVQCEFLNYCNDRL